MYYIQELKEIKHFLLSLDGKLMMLLSKILELDPLDLILALDNIILTLVLSINKDGDIITGLFEN